MPIYEYQCETCTHEFEELVRGVECVHCPHCQGASVRRKLSTFAKGGGAPVETFSAQATSSVSAGKCSGCSGGSCASCR